MHEIGLCQSVLAAVERRAAGRPVARVAVRAGALLHIVPEAFAQSFAMVAAGSVAEGAAVDLVILPVRCRCEQCDTTFETRDPLLSCPSCGGMRCVREGGDELVLESLEYRGPAEAPARVSRGSGHHIVERT
jgi:hydrogenase nickel incorporation protein HypA/HybF